MTDAEYYNLGELKVDPAANPPDKTYAQWKQIIDNDGDGKTLITSDPNTKGYLQFAGMLH